MKRLISISNGDSMDYNYHTWLNEVNSILKNGNARIINVTCTDSDFDDATAWIEIDEPEQTKKE